jgi:hypothetical protein
MSSVVISGDTSGTVTLTVPAVAGTNTITVPANTGTMVTTASSAVVTQAMLATNVAGNGPAFSATNSVLQNFSVNTFTKVTFDVENFDTNSNFASSRFTPTVAGYYYISASVLQDFGGAGGTVSTVSIYKNGSAYQITSIRGSTTYGGQQTQSLVYCNGSTDYVEIYILSNNASPLVGVSNSTSGTTLFTGFLAKAA